MAVVTRGGSIPSIKGRDAKEFIQQLQKKQHSNPEIVAKAAAVFDRFGPPVVVVDRKGGA